MTWTLETKTTDRAPTKRGDDWTQEVTHVIRDERGRYVVSAVEHDYPSMSDVLLTPAEQWDAMRLIAAAPALRNALMLAMEAINPFSSMSIAEAEKSGRAALALLDRVEVGK